MLKIKFLLLFVVIALTKQDCVVDPFDRRLTYNQPLLFWNGGNELVYPSLDNEESDMTITIPEGGEIAISCPQGKLLSNLQLSPNPIYTTCLDSQLRVGENILNFRSLHCNYSEYIGTIDVSSIPCGGGIGELFELVLPAKLEEYEDIPVFDICFNKSDNNVLLVHHNISKYLRFKYAFLGPVDYFDDGVYNFNKSVPVVYSDQQTSINRVLGLPFDSTKYVGKYSRLDEPNISNFVLDAKTLGDPLFYIYEISQILTLHYANTVPIWRTIWTHNWNSILREILNYVIDNPVDLESYVGTFGVSTLPHDETKDDQKLYLYSEEDNFLPVPGILWYLIYNVEEESAIAFLIVNNPYQVKPEDRLCQDISSDLHWFEFDNYNVTNGYTYACTYEDLKGKISYLPELKVSKILV